jgi:hypothetical protein
VQVPATRSDATRVEDPEARLGRGVGVLSSAPSSTHPNHPNENQPDPSPPPGHVGPVDAVRSHWWVECADPFGRCRAMNVVIHDDRVVVVAPPGESAVMSAQQTRLLGRALDRAYRAVAGPRPD